MCALLVYHPQSNFTSRFAADLPVDLRPMSELTGICIWLVQFFDWSSATVTNQAKNVSAFTTSGKEKNEVSLFLAFAICSRCSFGTGCRNCEAINPFYDFSVSKRNGLQPPSSHVEPITLGNELRIYDMIPHHLQQEFVHAQAKLFTIMPSALTSQNSFHIFLLSLPFSLSLFSLSLPLPLFLSVSLSPFFSLSLSLSLSLSRPELSVGLTMYQFLRYGGDLCWLFSLFFFWLAW